MAIMKGARARARTGTQAGPQTHEGTESGKRTRTKSRRESGTFSKADRLTTRLVVVPERTVCYVRRFCAASGPC